MTISITGPRISYSGNGSTTVFSFPRQFFLATDLDVYLVDTATNVSVLQTLGTHYSVSGAGSPSGGNITMVTAPPTGTTLVIVRDTPLTQGLDLDNVTSLPMTSLEAALDRAMMTIDEVNTKAVKGPLNTASTFNYALPTPVANLYLRTKSDVSGFEWAQGQPGPMGPSGSATAAKELDTVAALLADLTLTYTAGSNSSVVAGDYVKVRNGAFVYQVLASGASTYHMITAGAVKLNVLPVNDGYNVKAFGAKADGTDDSVAIQKAIDTGGTVRFPTGNYFAALLTQSTTGQRFFADGQVSIFKNANGTLLTSTGSYVEMQGLQFVGTGYTGDNIDCSGNHVRLVMCSSYGTPGIAARLRGAHSQIIGTSGSYSTTDTSATGYDIVIGTDGVATLYHQLVGVYTSQHTGGIKFIDCGGASVQGGQFGKLTIAKGSGGYISGSNGGQYTGCRIVGDVSIDQSNTAFSACMFGGPTVTISTGNTGVIFDPSCVYSSTTTVTNSANLNNLIVRNAYDGLSPFVHKLGVGDSATASWLGFDPTTGTLYTPAGMWIGYGVNAVLNLGGTSSYGAVTAGTGGLYMGSSGTSRYQFTDDYLRPVADNTRYLGSASQRWNTVYAGTGTINTSDRDEKQQIDALSDAEKAAGVELRGMVRKFKFNDAVAAKGDNARIHFGVIAQDVEAVFVAHGLDPSRYGLFCRDTWEAEDEVVSDDGVVLSPAKQAGTRLGIRYDELFAFIIGCL